MLLNVFKGEATARLATAVVLTCAAATGALGALVGLALGLRAHPPTAAAAAVEVGLPAALAGGLLGAVAAAVVVAALALTRARR